MVVFRTEFPKITAISSSCLHRAAGSAPWRRNTSSRELKDEKSSKWYFHLSPMHKMRGAFSWSDLLISFPLDEEARTARSSQRAGLAAASALLWCSGSQGAWWEILKPVVVFFFFFTFQTSIMFILASFYLYFSKVGDVQSLNVKTRLQSHNSHWLSTLRVHISRVLDEAGRGGDRDVSYEVIPYKTRDETLHIKFTVQSCKPEPGWDLSCFCLGMKVPLFQALWASFLLPGLPASRMLWALLHVHPVLCLAL